MNVGATPGAVTERGLRANLSVAFQYISFWLSGRGAAGINNLMEDAATAEIARSQVWQWIRQRSPLQDGRPVTSELVRALLDQETARIETEVGEEVFSRGRPAESREILERTALAEELPAFLPLLAYEHLD